MSSLRRLYEDLRSISVTVVYPPGEEREVLIDQLKRIGCRLQVAWPFPGTPPTGCDVIFFQVSQEIQDSASWNASSIDATLIALSDYESPTTLKLLLDTAAHGVITRPFRSAGVLSTLVLARSAQSFQQRMQGKIKKLEDTIKSRRLVEKAIRLLSESQNLSDTQAYEHMRARATKLRTSVAEISQMIIDAHEAIEKLGLGRSMNKG
jgi:AmiR/NasT family two-component response regulator